MINFESVEAKRFLSIGEDGIKIEFKKGLNVISGVNKDKDNRSNGTGKCVRGSTQVEVSIEDEEILKKFTEFIKK